MGKRPMPICIDKKHNAVFHKDILYIGIACDNITKRNVWRFRRRFIRKSGTVSTRRRHPHILLWVSTSSWASVIIWRAIWPDTISCESLHGQTVDYFVEKVFSCYEKGVYRSQWVGPQLYTRSRCKNSFYRLVWRMRNTQNLTFHFYRPPQVLKSIIHSNVIYNWL